MDRQFEVEKVLSEVVVSEIKSIVIRTVGLIDMFGKMLLDITYLDDTTKTIEIVSPVPTDIISKWLDTNNLLDKTIMYEF